MLCVMQRALLKQNPPSTARKPQESRKVPGPQTPKSKTENSSPEASRRKLGPAAQLIGPIPPRPGPKRDGSCCGHVGDVGMWGEARPKARWKTSSPRTCKERLCGSAPPPRPQTAGVPDRTPEADQAGAWTGTTVGRGGFFWHLRNLFGEGRCASRNSWAGFSTQTLRGPAEHFLFWGFCVAARCLVCDRSPVLVLLFLLRGDAYAGRLAEPAAPVPCDVDMFVFVFFLSLTPCEARTQGLGALLCKKRGRVLVCVVGLVLRQDTDGTTAAHGDLSELPAT